MSLKNTLKCLLTHESGSIPSPFHIFLLHSIYLWFGHLGISILTHILGKLQQYQQNEP